MYTIAQKKKRKETAPSPLFIAFVVPGIQSPLCAGLTRIVGSVSGSGQTGGSVSVEAVEAVAPVESTIILGTAGADQRCQKKLHALCALKV